MYRKIIHIQTKLPILNKKRIRAGKLLNGGGVSNCKSNKYKFQDFFSGNSCNLFHMLSFRLSKEIPSIVI